MRSPRGFGKHYFSLAAIQAYSSGVRFHARSTSARTHCRRCTLAFEADSEAEETEEATEALLVEQPEPSGRFGRPRRIFRRRSGTATRNPRSVSRSICRCRKTKSGIAPP